MVQALQHLKALVCEFCKVDSYRTFNFTSGHLGAMPMTDEEFLCYFTKACLPQSLLIQYFIFGLSLVLPYKNYLILVRTLLRKHLSPPLGSKKSLTVLSLGDTCGFQDPYFGKLLLQTKQEFNYLKIVGGSQIRSSKYHFVEVALSSRLILLAIFIAPVLQLLFLFRLLQAYRQLKGGDKQKLFVLLALSEINSGITLNQTIIVWALRRHITQDTTLLYPLEGRNWEKNIVARANRVNARSLGYLHCALTPRHLSLLHQGFLKKQEWPSMLITPGEMATTLLSKTHVGLNIRQGYFLRGNENSSHNRQRRPYLLFALTGNIPESEEILRNISVFAKSCNTAVVVRLNPNTSSISHLRSFTIGLGLSLYDPKEASLPQLCFFRSSSVAIDYLRNDVVPIYLDTGEFISTNIFNLDGKFSVESVKLDNTFCYNVTRLMIKYPLNLAFDGRRVSNYYLAQDFSSQDLSTLLNLND